MNFSVVEKNIGYRFKDRRLLMRALTLASYDNKSCNETLEFFGDAILEFVVSERIFSEGISEGELTEMRKTLVSDAALTPVSERLGLDKFLIRGKQDNLNKKAVPSAYEAVTAAIYLDGGMDSAKKFVLSTLDFSADKPLVNYKGELQELLQGSGQPVPEYNRRDIGTPQRHIFKVTLNIFGKTFEAQADSVKEAEQLTAKSALAYYNGRKQK